MAHDLSIVVIGLCLFALAAILVPDNFGMPIDDEGNLSDGRDMNLGHRQPVKHKKNGPSGDRPWGR